MAWILEKSTTYGNSVKSNYHYVAVYTANKHFKRLEATVYSFGSKADRLADFPPLEQQNMVFVGDDYEQIVNPGNGNVNVNKIYQLGKEPYGWSEAEDDNTPVDPLIEDKGKGK